MSCMDVHTGNFIVVLTVFTFMFRSHLSLLSLWLWEDNQFQYMAQGLAYIVCVPCTGLCIESCTADIVIAMSHPHTLSLPMVCKYMYTTCKAVVVELLQSMQNSECLSFYVDVSSLCA